MTQRRAGLVLLALHDSVAGLPEPIVIVGAFVMTCVVMLGVLAMLPAGREALRDSLASVQLLLRSRRKKTPEEAPS